MAYRCPLIPTLQSPLPIRTILSMETKMPQATPRRRRAKPRIELPVLDLATVLALVGSGPQKYMWTHAGGTVLINSGPSWHSVQDCRPPRPRYREADVSEGVAGSTRPRQFGSCGHQRRPARRDLPPHPPAFGSTSAEKGRTRHANPLTMVSNPALPHRTHIASSGSCRWHG